MDHAVHINGKDNGSRAAKPIVLRLLPGEETIFNLKVVNHGEPSNISLLASSPVFKAVRLRKPDHYVVMEEIIPVMARMPAGKKRLDGEIILSSPAGKSRVPITLLRESEDPADDLVPGPAVDADLLDGEQEGDREVEDGEEDGPNIREAQEDADGADDVDDDNDNNYDEDDPDAPPKRKRGEQDDDGDEAGEGEEGPEPRRITFSRDQDLQRYRSASRRRKAADRPRPEDEVEQGDRAVSRTPPRFVTRIDDSFVDKSTRNAEGWPSEGSNGDGGAGRGLDGSGRASGPLPGQIGPIESENETENLSENASPGYRRDGDRESRERFDSAEREDLASGFQDIPRQQEDFGQGADEPDRADGSSAVERGGQSEYDGDDGNDGGYEAEGERGTLLERLDGLSLGTTQIIPAVIFLALVAMLVLTFIMQAIPEFAGALASSILIVTLIIYGAAILLKA